MAVREPFCHTIVLAEVSHDPTVADKTVRELLDTLASDHSTPGSGAAAAVALALAAGCGGKAVAISLKHRPANAALLQNRERLSGIVERALRGADEDARRFEDFLQSDDPVASLRLAKAETAMRDLADELMIVLRDVRDHVVPSVTGDIVAAAALRGAAMAIEAENLSETRRESTPAS